MRSSWSALVVLVGGLLAVPQLAAGADVEKQLQKMQERLTQLEDQLSETSRELEVEKGRAEEQRQVMERAGLAEGESPVVSGLSSFLEQTEISGWVEASYWYNTNTIDDDSPARSVGANTGTFGGANPLHPDTNTFQVDQVWFEMFKAATEESRAGFGIELVFGKTADNLRGDGSDSGDLSTIYQGYVEYLAPIGPGLKITAGRYATHIGYEVVQSPYNYALTRGLTFNLLQPFNTVGAKASMEFDNGFDFMVGITNSAFDNLNTDDDDDKTFQWRVGYTGDTWALGVNGLYGGNAVDDAGRNSDRTGIVNVLATWDPSESLSTYIDYTYVWFNNDPNPGNPEAHGLALGGRYAITEDMGFALRAEYIRSEDDFLGISTVGTTDQDLWSITATTDYLLTDNLTVRAEVRYEEGSADNGPDDFYFEDTNGVDENQVLLGIAMLYRF